MTVRRGTQATRKAPSSMKSHILRAVNPIAVSGSRLSRRSTAISMCSMRASTSTKRAINSKTSFSARVSPAGGTGPISEWCRVRDHVMVCRRWHNLSTGRCFWRWSVRGRLIPDILRCPFSSRTMVDKRFPNHRDSLYLRPMPVQPEVGSHRRQGLGTRKVRDCSSQRRFSTMD